ncbi:hypothetical protein GCM10027344_02730 [Spelaeicoccus albus]
MLTATDRRRFPVTGQWSALGSAESKRGTRMLHGEYPDLRLLGIDGRGTNIALRYLDEYMTER